MIFQQPFHSQEVLHRPLARGTVWQPTGELDPGTTKQDTQAAPLAGNSFTSKIEYFGFAAIDWQVELRRDLGRNYGMLAASIYQELYLKAFGQQYAVLGTTKKAFRRVARHEKFGNK